MKIESVAMQIAEKAKSLNPYSNGMKIECDEVRKAMDPVIVLILILME